tara:strand:+ start:168 stop:788 length:621 start_codon:yes stop_codon:yes gene_type:complete
MAENPNACALITKGRGLDCNRIAGGIQYIYFGVADTTEVTQSWTGVTAGWTTDIDMDPLASGTNTDLYRYALPRGTASFTDTLVGSRENGTIFYTPTVQMVLDKLDGAMQNEMRLLGATQVVVFCELNQMGGPGVADGHNVIFCLGGINGMQLNAGTDTSGAALGDRNGYDLTWDGVEATPATQVIDYTTDPFDNLPTGAINIIKV